MESELVVSQFKDGKIKEATIMANKGDFSIDFITDYSDDRRALYATQKVLEDLTKIFMYEEGHEIRNLKWSSITPISVDATEEKRIILRDDIFVRSELTIIRPLENEQGLKDKLEQYSSDDFTNFVNLFIEISRMNDELGKFVLYYSLLSAIFGKQKKVDEFIISKEPNVELRETAREDADFDETIYSFLRNQVGHTSEETDTNILISEINGNIKGLRKIVKSAIDFTVKN